MAVYEYMELSKDPTQSPIAIRLYKDRSTALVNDSKTCFTVNMEDGSDRYVATANNSDNAVIGAYDGSETRFMLPSVSKASGKTKVSEQYQKITESTTLDAEALGEKHIFMNGGYVILEGGAGSTGGQGSSGTPGSTGGSGGSGGKGVEVTYTDSYGETGYAIAYGGGGGGGGGGSGYTRKTSTSSSYNYSYSTGTTYTYEAGSAGSGGSGGKGGKVQLDFPEGTTKLVISIGNSGNGKAGSVGGVSGGDYTTSGSTRYYYGGSGGSGGASGSGTSGSSGNGYSKQNGGSGGKGGDASNASNSSTQASATVYIYI